MTGGDEVTVLRRDAQLNSSRYDFHELTRTVATPLDENPAEVPTEEIKIINGTAISDLCESKESTVDKTYQHSITKVHATRVHTVEKRKRTEVRLCETMSFKHIR